MSLAIIHISDIHIENDDKELQRKFAAVPTALETSDIIITDVVLLLSGDVANSGRTSEYEIAKRELTALLGKIRRIGSVQSVTVFAIPGNHDCDLSSDQEIRDLVISGKLSMPSELLSDKKLTICLEPQSNFFKFASELGDTETSALDYQAAPRRVITVNGVRVGFLGFNTALFTKRNEEPGKLVILNRALDTLHIPKCEILICAVHHPLSWLSYDCVDRLKTFTRARVDFLFSGHEHRRELFSKESLDGLGTVFCEAGSFHKNSDPHKSSFQICLVDVSRALYKLRALEWKENTYRIVEESTWQAVKSFKGSVSDRLPITPSFRSFINDPGAQYTHPRVGTLRLGDFLIPPIVKSLDKDDASKVTNFSVTSKTIERIAGGQGIVLIYAAERFGKTTLAKVIFNECYDGGQSPLYVDVKDLQRFDQEVRVKMIEQAAKRVYAIQGVEEYLSVKMEDRVLIIDNFGLAALTLDKQREFLSSHLSSFSKIIVLGNELMKVQITSGRNFVPEKVPCVSFEIEELGYKAREDLIRRWSTAGELIRDDETHLERKVQRSMEMVETVLGQNLLPSTPFFVLAVLQLIEADSPVQTSNSGSYGFIYEYLITQALGRSRQIKDLNLKYSYLSDLAYKLFSESKVMLDEAELRIFHADYVQRKKIECEHSKLLADFIASQIFEARDGILTFKYRYLYYYFIARFISERFHNEEYRLIAFSFVDKLHNENLFNVLVFLVYLVKDPALKERILSHASGIFKETTQLDFIKDRSRIAALGEIADSVVFDDIKAATAKDEVFDQLTRLARDRTARTHDAEREIDSLNEVNRSFKAIQLLGQTVKNFVGSMDGAEKIRFVETCFDLSLRTMSAMMKMVEDAAPGFAFSTYRKMIAESELKAAKMRVLPVIKESEVHHNTREMIYRHAQIMCLAVIKKVSVSIGSTELEPVYGAVANGKANFSYDVLNTTIKLDHFRTLPLGDIKALSKVVAEDPFLGGIVRRLVLLHFYLFPINDRLRAEVCSLLDISFKGTKPLAHGTRKQGKLKS